MPLDKKGMPVIDPMTLRIGDLPVFLVGDANGYRALLHETADEGHIAGRMAAPDATGGGLCRRTPLSIVFSSPQLARVGPPLSDLQDIDIATGSFDFSKQARARMAQTNTGVLRIHAARETGRLLAAEMCAPDAEHLAHSAGTCGRAAHERGRHAGNAVLLHPVLEEGLRSALRDSGKGCVWNRTDPTCRTARRSGMMRWIDRALTRWHQYVAING